MKKSLLVAAALMSLFLAACNNDNQTPASSEASAVSEVSAPVASDPVPASEPAQVPAQASEVSAPAVASEASAASN